jgi:hypothetical protein
MTAEKNAGNPLQCDFSGIEGPMISGELRRTNREGVKFLIPRGYLSGPVTGGAQGNDESRRPPTPMISLRSAARQSNTRPLPAGVFSTPSRFPLAQHGYRKTCPSQASSVDSNRQILIIFLLVDWQAVAPGLERTSARSPFMMQFLVSACRRGHTPLLSGRGLSSSKSGPRPARHSPDIFLHHCRIPRLHRAATNSSRGRSDLRLKEPTNG